MKDRVLLVFASPEERREAAILEKSDAPFMVGHLDRPGMLAAAVAKVRPALVIFYLCRDVPGMLEHCRRLRAGPRPFAGAVVFCFPEPSRANMELTLEAGADGMLVNVWTPEELVVRIGSMLKVGFVNRESHRRTSALAHANAEAADIILQLEEATRKIKEQNLCITAQQEKIAAHLEKVKEELRIASLLQISLLPSAREYSQGSGLVLRDRYVPATDLGGDYFDYAHCPDGRLFVCVADVTGHGVAPALVSVQSRALARSHLEAGQGLAAMTSDLNTFMFETFQQDYLMTMAALAYDRDDGKVEFCGAGHCPLVHYLAAEDRCVERFSRGVPLGVMDDAVFASDVFALAPGDWLLVYTDGITEATSPAGEEFGVERLLEAFLGLVRAGEKDVPNRLLDAAREFTGKPTFNDDVTLVALERPRESGEPE